MKRNLSTATRIRCWLGERRAVETRQSVCKLSFSVVCSALSSPGSCWLTKQCSQFPDRTDRWRFQVKMAAKMGSYSLCRCLACQQTGNTKICSRSKLLLSLSLSYFFIWFVFLFLFCHSTCSMYNIAPQSVTKVLSSSTIPNSCKLTAPLKYLFWGLWDICCFEH